MYNLAAAVAILSIIGHCIEAHAFHEMGRSFAHSNCTLAPSSPTLSCNLRGFYKESHYMNTTSTEAARSGSVEDCALLCSEHQEDCKAFEYNAVYQSCQFFYVPVSEVFDPESNPDSPHARVYNDYGCYDCGDQFCGSSAQPYGKQLLANGDFEDPYLGPWYVADGVSYFSPGYNSSHRVQIGNEDIDYDSYEEVYYDTAFVAQAINFCKGEFYDISFSYKYQAQSSHSLFKSAIGDRYQDTFMTVTPSEGAAGIGEWARARAVINPREMYGPVSQHPYEHPYGLIFLGVLNMNDIYIRNNLAFDSARISRHPYPKPIPGGGSPQSFKGDFESGSGNPWKIGQKDVSVTSPGLRGSKYAAVLPGFRTIVQQNITTTPNTMYVLAGDVLNKLNFKNGSSGVPILSATLGLSSGGFFTKTYHGKFSRSRKIAKFSRPLFAQGNSTSVQIELTPSSSQTTGSILVDNITLRKMQE